MYHQEEDLVALLNDSGEGTLNQSIARARETVDRLHNVELNIAITGVTGAGKSTLVNALRGVGDTDEGAAPTGVQETTVDVRAYPHPTMPNVKVWDLPGIGSTQFKAETYMKDVNFTIYDFFIIVNNKRFKEEEIMLAKEIEKQNKKFYFVRTMIDEDVRASVGRRSQTEKQTLHEIREYCKKQLWKMGPPPIFLISAFDPKKFDFPELLDTLERDLPQHKRDALVLSLPVYTLASLEQKYNTFKSKVWALAALSGVLGAAPLVGAVFDATLLQYFFNKCYYSFGLDDRSLIKLGERVNKPLLAMARESALVRAIADKTFLSRTMLKKLGVAAVIEAICSLVPVAGNIAAAGISYVTTQSVLLEGLNELYRVAKKVIEMAELT